MMTSIVDNVGSSQLMRNKYDGLEFLNNISSNEMEQNILKKLEFTYEQCYWQWKIFFRSCHEISLANETCFFPENTGELV